jgi:hypothetical protein
MQRSRSGGIKPCLLRQKDGTTYGELAFGFDMRGRLVRVGATCGREPRRPRMAVLTPLGGGSEARHRQPSIGLQALGTSRGPK